MIIFCQVLLVEFVPKQNLFKPDQNDVISELQISSFSKQKSSLLLNTVEKETKVQEENLQQYEINEREIYQEFIYKS